MKLLFIFTLVYFTLIGWCSNNWFLIWLMMEFSFLVFIGFISIEVNYNLTEMMMKYFITQVFISLMLILLILFFTFELSLKYSTLMVSVMLMKLGLFPFHYWIIMILGKIGWFSFFVMTTLLKFFPILFLYYSFPYYNLDLVLLMSLFIGSLFGVNNSIIQKLMGYSSLVHLSWILMSLMISLKLFYLYVFTYLVSIFVFTSIFSLLNIYYINQFKLTFNNLFPKFFFFFLVLSLAGFPPTMGFIVKWILISESLMLNMKILMYFSVVLSLFSIIFYFQLFFYIMMISSLEVKWFKANYFVQSSLFFICCFSILVFYFLIYLNI